ncbi:hypothetical protein BDZ45DRAFT_674314 [Acephala macrosclerotiorum]|nr:hypothetical protein BDZ45DRAFT_674314 [Acephala macrosclerotiorum]
MTRPRALSLTQYFKSRHQINEFSNSSRSRYFLDPKKLFALSERLGKKPMEDYLPPFRNFLVFFVARTDELKRDIERNNRKALKRGGTEKKIDCMNRWSFTTAIVIFVSTQWQRCMG